MTNNIKLKDYSKTKKYNFRDFKVSYLSFLDAQKAYKENGIEFTNSEETCLFLYGSKFWSSGYNVVFCLKGNHVESILRIKKECTKKYGYSFYFDDAVLQEFLEYAKKNKHLLINNS